LVSEGSFREANNKNEGVLVRVSGQVHVPLKKVGGVQGRRGANSNVWGVQLTLGKKQVRGAAEGKDPFINHRGGAGTFAIISTTS